MNERVRCVKCGLVFAGRVPKGGDGSAMVPYPHKREDFNNFNGRILRVPCDGKFLVGERIEVSL